MSTSSHIVRDSLIAMNKGDEVWDVLAPVIFTAGVSAITMATPMLRPNPGAAQISTAIAHSLTLGAPRVGVGLSVAAGFFGKKIYNTFAHYDEVASTENHDWSEALVPFAQGAAELTSAVGLSVAGNFLGRGLGQAVLVPALTVVAGPEIAMAAGPVLGAGLAFFAIKEASSYISDTAHYDFISQQTALNFAGSMLFIGLHPLAYSGMGRLFGTSALSWTTHFQRVFFSGLTANTAVAAVDHAISGTNDFAHTWARDLRASALVNASSILGYAFHRPPNYRPPTSETPLSVEKIGKYTLERTSDPQLATLRQNGYPDISWVVDAKNLPQNPMHSDITPLIKGMKVWSPYRRDFFTVERSAGLTEAEVTNFMRGLNPKLVQQAGGTETVMDIMMGRTPISTVSQYQIRLCFDNFRHALPDMDASSIYGS